MLRRKFVPKPVSAQRPLRVTKQYRSNYKARRFASGLFSLTETRIESANEAGPFALKNRGSQAESEKHKPRLK